MKVGLAILAKPNVIIELRRNPNNCMSNYIYQDNLESDRLLTRKLIQNDAKTWATFFTDKDAIEYLPNPGFNSVEGLGI